MKNLIAIVSLITATQFLRAADDSVIVIDRERDQSWIRQANSCVGGRFFRRG